MKVYELMDELSRVPAGAEVKFNGILSVSDILSGVYFDTDEKGIDLYSVSKSVNSIDAETTEVYLYF